MEFIDKIIQFMSEDMMMQAGVVSMVLEMLFRFIKTERPLSIMYVVKGVFSKLSEVFDIMAKFMDKVLPQRLKEEDK
jgi:hypothetical protein